MGHATFGDYCQKRWSMARQTAYKHIKASVVAENVRSTVQNQPFLTQAVNLASLTPEQQRDVVAKLTSPIPLLEHFPDFAF
jgi:hypothetical protein